MKAPVKNEDEDEEGRRANSWGRMPAIFSWFKIVKITHLYHLHHNIGKFNEWLMWFVCCSFEGLMCFACQWESEDFSSAEVVFG